MHGISSRKERLQLVCTKRLGESISAVIEPGFKRAGQELVEAAKHPTDAKVRTEALNGLHALNSGRSAFERAFITECGKLVADTPASLRSAASGKSRNFLPTGDGLSLMDEESLEHNNALQTFVARAETKYAQELYALSSRLGMINGKKYEDLAQCPLGPARIAAAMAQSTRSLGLPNLATPYFAKGFCETLLTELGDFYYDLNDELAGQKILPNLKYKRINRGRLGPRPTGGGKSSGEDRDYFDRPKSQAPSNTEVTVSNIRRLLREIQPDPVGDPAGPRVQPENLDRALADLQSDMATGRLEGRLNGDDLRYRLLKAISGKDYGGQSVSIGIEDSHTIEIMSQLFEFVDRQRLLNQRLAKTVAKLQMPMFRVAVQDQQLLQSGAHPARRFFNVLTDAGKLWSEKDERDCRMIRQMETVVERAVHEYDGDDALFEELLQDLSTHIEVAEKRARVAERRAVEAAKGKEQLERSRFQAHRYIRKVIEKYQLQDHQVPNQFLSDPWSDYLTLLMLREESPTSKAFKQACLAAETLGTHNCRGLHQEHMEILMKRREPLGVVVGRGLEQLGWAEDDRTVVWRALCGWMDARIAHRTPRLDEQIEMPEHAQFGEAVEQATERLPNLTQEQKRVLAHLSRMPFGTWFEFDDDEALRKLAWYSTVTSHLLFVNNRGARALQSTLHELAVWVDQKKARLFKPPSRPVFDRALSFILSRLEKIKERFGGGGPNPSPTPVA